VAAGFAVYAAGPLGWAAVLRPIRCRLVPGGRRHLGGIRRAAGGGEGRHHHDIVDAEPADLFADATIDMTQGIELPTDSAILISQDGPCWAAASSRFCPAARWRTWSRATRSKIRRASVAHLAADEIRRRLGRRLRHARPRRPADEGTAALILALAGGPAAAGAGFADAQGGVIRWLDKLTGQTGDMELRAASLPPTGG
jgi:hypothetical protein